LSKRCILGIDGGGTKTESVIIDDSGTVLGTGLGKGCNTSFTPVSAACRAVKRSVVSALKSASLSPADIDCVGVCVCGRSSVFEDTLKDLGIAAERFGFGEPTVSFERAGVSERRGVVIVAGTGSFSAAIDGEKEFFTGGWGAILGDEGSAFDIGVRGVKTALASSDGRIPESALLAAAYDYFKVRQGGLVYKLCGTTVKRALIAGFAVRVAKAAEQGDQAAAGIIEGAGEDLGELGAFAARHVFSSDDSFPFVLAGGVFNIGEPIISPIRSVLSPQFPKASFAVQKMGPGEAVARLAQRKCSRRH